jgi:hypothetical protein
MDRFHHGRRIPPEDKANSQAAQHFACGEQFLLAHETPSA